MTHAEMTALPAGAFLTPETFRTPFDGLPAAYADDQYAHGLDVSRKYARIAIGESNVWSASNPGVDGGDFLCSYERIGYHAHTASLLRGMLAGPAEIVVYRRGHAPTTIKGRTLEPASVGGG